MAVQPYKVNKESPIDFLLAGVRGTLAGIAGGKAAQDQRKQLELENSIKMSDLQLRKDQLDQSWKISQNEIQARKDAILQGSQLDLTKAQIVHEYDVQLTNLQLGTRLVGDIISNGMQMETEKSRAKAAVFENNRNYQLDLKQYEETVRSHKASETAREANISGREATLDIAEQRLALATENAEFNRQDKIIGRNLQLVNQLKTEAATKATPTIYNTLLRLQSRATEKVSTDNSAENIQQYNRMNLATAKYAYDNFAQDNVVNLQIKKTVGYGKVNLLYSQYLDLLITKTLPNGDTLSEKQMSPIITAELPPGVDIEINKDLNKDKTQQEYRGRIKIITDEIDKLSSMNAVVETPPTEPAPKPYIFQKPTKLPTTENTWKGFVNKIMTFNSYKSAYLYLTKNKTIINKKYAMPDFLDQLIADIKPFADKE